MARDKKVNIVIRAKDTASRSIKGIKKNLLNLKNFIASTAIFAGLIKGFQAVTKAAGIQQDAIASLNKQLKINGVFSQATTNLLQQQARAIQRVTKFGDEEIIQLQTILSSFGLQVEAIDETVRATLDLSTALGIDLKAASILMGRAVTGSTETLSRYGLMLDEGIPKNEKFVALLKLIQDRFGGRAQAEAETYTGKIKQLNNTFGDFKETLGFTITESEDFRGVLTGLKENIEAVILVLERKRAADDAAAKSAMGHNDALGNLDKGLEKLGKTSVLLELQKDFAEARNRTNELKKELEDISVLDVFGEDEFQKQQRLIGSLKEQADVLNQINTLMGDENIQKGFREFLEEAAKVKLQPSVDIFKIEQSADAAYLAFKQRFETNAQRNPPKIPTIALPPTFTGGGG